MPEQLYASKSITLTKRFLMKTHVHHLLSDFEGVAIDDDLYIRMWEKTPEMSQASFGGAYGSQFSSIAELQSFEEAFDSILIKHKIKATHKAPLQYFISFLAGEDERQSLNNNRSNRLLEYTKFVLDLHRNCVAHFEAMEKNTDYQMIYDEACREYFFAKKNLFDRHTLEEIAEDRPQYNPGDIISYMRVDVYETELYVPYDLVFSITSERQLREFGGKVIPSIKLPAYIQSELFKFSLKYMLDEHKKNNTLFYQDAKRPGLIPEDFKKLYNKYGKHAISQTESLIRVALVISDYLIEETQIKTKRAIAAFLFNYFSLFKVFQTRTGVNPPNNYGELARFYNQHGITSETVRLMLKDMQ